MHLIPNDRQRARENHSFKDINGSFVKDDRIYKKSSSENFNCTNSLKDAFLARVEMQ